MALVNTRHWALTGARLRAVSLPSNWHFPFFLTACRGWSIYSHCHSAPICLQPDLGPACSNICVSSPSLCSSIIMLIHSHHPIALGILGDSECHLSDMANSQRFGAGTFLAQAMRSWVSSFCYSKWHIYFMKDIDFLRLHHCGQTYWPAKGRASSHFFPPLLYGQKGSPLEMLIMRGPEELKNKEK